MDLDGADMDIPATPFRHLEVQNTGTQLPPTLFRTAPSQRAPTETG